MLEPAACRLRGDLVSVQSHEVNEPQFPYCQGPTSWVHVRLARAQSPPCPAADSMLCWAVLKYVL